VYSPCTFLIWRSGRHAVRQRGVSVCDAVCIEPVVVGHVMLGGECSGRREWMRGCCCCCCCPYCSSRSVVQRLDGIGDNERECTFVVFVVVLVAAYPNGVGLGCSCCVANGRRWWVVRIPCCVVRWGLDSEHGGMHNLVCANLIVALLTVLSKGSMRWEVLTWWYLRFSCFSFQLSYLPLFPRLPLLTLPIVLVRCPRPLVGLDWV
jgi:hypothetical protein